MSKTQASSPFKGVEPAVHHERAVRALERLGTLCYHVAKPKKECGCQRTVFTNSLVGTKTGGRPIAGVVRGQLPYLEEHIAQKKAIYERYKEGFKDLPVSMNPLNPDGIANYWLSCLIVDRGAMCKQVRSENEALYIGEHGKSCPTEILDTLACTLHPYQR